MTEPLKVSFSRLNAFARCPLQFRHRYIDKLSNDELDDPLYRKAGVVFHQAAEHVTNPFDPSVMRAAIEHKGRVHGQRVVDRALGRVDAFGEFITDDGPREVVKSEYEILEYWTDPDTGDDIRFHGFVDRVVRGDKGLILDDWKLGRKVPSDVAQLQTYAPLVAERLGEPVSLLRDVYLGPSGYKVEAFVPMMTADDVRDLFSDMAAMLYHGQRYPGWGSLTDSCRTCAFRNSCPWAGLGSTASVRVKG